MNTSTSSDGDSELERIAEALVAEAPEVPSLHARSDAVSTALPRRTPVVVGGAAVAVLALGVTGMIHFTGAGSDGTADVPIDGSAPITEPGPSSPPNDTLTGDEYVYVVIQGDSLNGIATRFCVSVGDLGAANDWDDLMHRRIHPGDILALPESICIADGYVMDYVVQQGDSPNLIAERLCVEIDELYAANRWSADDPASFIIIPDQVIRVPASRC